MHNSERASALTAFRNGFLAAIATTAAIYIATLVASGFSAPLASIYVVAVVLPPVLVGLGFLALWTLVTSGKRFLTGSFLSLCVVGAADFLMLGQLAGVNSVAKAFSIVFPSIVAGLVAVTSYYAIERIYRRAKTH
jgi:uncharacterized membrane protein required for colicin V production